MKIRNRMIGTAACALFLGSALMATAEQASAMPPGGCMLHKYPDAAEVWCVQPVLVQVHIVCAHAGSPNYSVDGKELQGDSYAACNSGDTLVSARYDYDG